MSTFNIEEGQKLLDNRDFYGYANYLSKHKAKDARSQSIVNEKIKEYTRLGDIQQSILENRSEDEQWAFNFISGMNGVGTIPNKFTYNSYANQYLNAVNTLQSNDGKKIYNLELKYNNEDEFNQLCNSLNTTKEEINSKYNVVTNNNSDNGSISLIIGTDNKLLPVILDRNYEFDIPNVEQGVISPESRYFGMMIRNDKRRRNGNRIQAIDETGRTLSIDEFNKSNLDDLLNVYKYSKNIYDKILSDQKSDSFEERLHITPFMSSSHKRAYDDWKAGKLKTSEYNNIVKAKTEYYNTLLKGYDFTSNPMFALQYKKGEDAVLREVSNENRNTYNALVSLAISENRVTYSSGELNGQLGTVITIAQRRDDDKLSENETNTFTRIFVPGLFNKKAQSAFNADTQGEAVITNADMRRWNYGKTLYDGTRIGYDKIHGSYATQIDENNNVIRVPVSQEYILHKLNEDNIIKSSVNTLYNLFDDNGNINTSLNIDKIKFNKLVTDLATKGADELYPKTEYTSAERINERDRIFRAILQSLYNRLKK